MARNQLIEMATASLSDLMKEHPEHRAEAKQDLQFLNVQKMGEHEAEIEKIKNVFLAILRDIKNIAVETFAHSGKHWHRSPIFPQGLPLQEGSPDFRNWNR